MSWGTEPTIVVIGRPNVGKSTLFNKLARCRDAIVADEPGVTVDLNDRLVSNGTRQFRLVDSGGFDGAQTKDPIALERNKKVIEAVRAADGILFVVDVRAGRVTQDDLLWNMVRKYRKKDSVLLVLGNKADEVNKTYDAIHEFSAWDVDVIPVSAEHNTGLAALTDVLFETFGKEIELADVLSEGQETQESPYKTTQSIAESERAIRIAFIGRPNVGKSTWANRVLNEERSVVTDVPGTTRDVVRSQFVRDGVKFEVCDTAGLRRPGRREEGVESVSGSKALRAIEDVDVAILVVDATEGVTDLDARIASEAWERGAGLIVLANKWDVVGKEIALSKWKWKSLYKLSYFGEVASVIAASGKTGKGEDALFKEIIRIAHARTKKLSTHDLNEKLRAWTKEQPHRRTPKGNLVSFHYIVQTARGPQRFLLLSNRPKQVDQSYLRYIEKRMREEFHLSSNPIYFAVSSR